MLSLLAQISFVLWLNQPLALSFGWTTTKSSRFFVCYDASNGPTGMVENCRMRMTAAVAAVSAATRVTHPLCSQLSTRGVAVSH